MTDKIRATIGRVPFRRRFACLPVLLAALFMIPPADRALAESRTWSYELRKPPGEGPFPAVIFLPGCGGYGPVMVRAGADKHANILLERGYAVALLDLLKPRGLDSICTELFWFDRMRIEGLRDVAAAARALAAEPGIDPDRIAFLGQSFGGSMALDIASISSRKTAKVGPIVKTVIAYYPYCYGSYGGGGTVDYDIPVLIMTGELDDWTPIGLCQGFPPRDPTVEVRVEAMSGARHSFDLDMELFAVEGVGDGGRIKYHLVEGNPAAAERSRALYLDWLDARL
jgi:dienelactone hydrolase